MMNGFTIKKKITADYQKKTQISGFMFFLFQMKGLQSLEVKRKKLCA